jgi:uncharacterized protein (TIGR04222 family)
VPVVTDAGGDTWGISGPEFLLLYGAGFLLTVVVVLLTRRLLSRRAAVDSTAELEPYELAALSGGMALVVHTALVHLYRTGVLTVQNQTLSALGAGGTAGWTMEQVQGLAASSGVVVVGYLPDGSPPVERAVVQAVTARPGIRPHDLRAAVESSPEAQALWRALEEKGLRRASGERWRLRAAALWWLPLTGVGLARVQAGSANGKPVAFLVMALIVTGVAFLLSLKAGATPLRARALLQKAWKQEEALQAEVQAAYAANTFHPRETYAMALFGTALLWSASPAMAGMFGAPAHLGGVPVTSGGGGGSSCSSGSSCGGGGCGGGGCGG